MFFFKKIFSLISNCFHRFCWNIFYFSDIDIYFCIFRLIFILMTIFSPILCFFLLPFLSLIRMKWKLIFIRRLTPVIEFIFILCHSVSTPGIMSFILSVFQIIFDSKILSESQVFCYKKCFQFFDKIFAETDESILENHVFICSRMF